MTPQKLAWETVLVNHEGQSENLLGMVLNSEEEAYKLYNKYVMQIEFSIRKIKIIYSKNGVENMCIQKKDFHEKRILVRLKR